MVDKKQLESDIYRLKDQTSLKKLFVSLNYDNADNPVDKENWGEEQKNKIDESRIIARLGDFRIFYIKNSEATNSELKSIATKIISKYEGKGLICIQKHANENDWIFSTLSKDFSKNFKESRHFLFKINPKDDVLVSLKNFFKSIEIMENENSIQVFNKINNAFDTFSFQIHNELTVNVFEAYKSLTEGIIIDKNNNFKLNDESLEKVRSPIFILLYRLIFVLYAESRNVFDTENSTYYQKFSLEWIKQEWILNLESLSKLPEYEVQKRIQYLFHLIEVGSDALELTTDEFSMISYYGRLFDRDIHKELEKWRIPNKYFLDAISFISRTKVGKSNYFFLDYSALKTRHLGSIYEHLLEFHLTIKNNKIGNLPDPKDRKISGSYYTPDYIVEHIVKSSLEPLILKIINEFSNKNTQIEKIFSLKILDPAMGSGHFLIGAVNYLAEKLCKIKYDEIKENELNELKREVVRRCIFGVDLNPLAVDLSSVALWLETLSHDKPLSFLQAHLKNGNSLIGSKIKQIYDSPITIKESEKDTEYFRKSVKEFLAFEEMSDDDGSVVKAKIRQYRKMRSKGTDYYDLKYLLNATTAKLFGLKIPPLGDFRAEIGEKGLDFYSSDEGPAIKQLAESNNFFHWELEFPEIYFDNNGERKLEPGFDVIIGNPPYQSGQELSEEVKIYLKEILPNFYNGQNDLHYYFIQKGLELLKKEGVIEYIVSRYFFEALHGKLLRKYIIENSNIKKIIDFSILRNFEEADTLTTILKLEGKTDSDNTRSNEIQILKVIQDKAWKVKDYQKISKEILNSIDNKIKSSKEYDENFEIFTKEQQVLTDEKWFFSTPKIEAIKNKMNESAKTLDNYFDTGQGMKTGLNEAFVVNEDIVMKYKLEKEYLRNYIKTRNIRQYQIIGEKTKCIILSEDVNSKNIPNILKYLFPWKEKLEERYSHKNKNKKWYSWSLLQNADLFSRESPKIITPLYSVTNKFAFDLNTEDQSYMTFTDTYIICPKNKLIPIKIMLALLNSKLIEFYFKNSSKLKDLGKYEYTSNSLSKIPIKIPDVEIQNEIIDKVDNILNLMKDKEIENIEFDKIIIIKEEIDNLVYDLYNITENEKKMIRFFV
jgi:hypothetical protein